MLKTGLAKTLKFLVLSGIYLVYIKISRLGISEWSHLSELLNGTARRPFIYRVFLPQSAQLLAKLSPFSISSESIQPKILQDAFVHLEGDIFPKEAFWVLAIIFFSMAGFLYVEKRFLSDLGFSKETQGILPVLLLILTLPFTVHFGYIYDMPQLFLFTASLWMLFQKRWGWYFAFFLTTTLNKETSILLLAVYTVYFYRSLERKEFLKLFLAQFFLYAFVRTILIWLFSKNPGNILYPAFLIHIDQYKTQPILFILTIALFGVIFYLVRKEWHKKNDFLKAGTIVPLLMLPLFFIGGMPMEFRVFLEALPILGVLIFSPEKL